MMYPFLTLNDDTEIVHSEMLPSGEVLEKWLSFFGCASYFC